MHSWVLLEILYMYGCFLYIAEIDLYFLLLLSIFSVSGNVVENLSIWVVE